MSEDEIAKAVVQASYRVHTRLGPGLLESVYETVLAYELRKAGLHVDRQVVIPIRYDGMEFEEGFRADLIMGGKVIVEIKSIEAVDRVHKKQVITFSG